jgi:sporulation integral membrane protein YtvI
MRIESRRNEVAMNLEKQKAFIIHSAYIVLLLGIVYVSIKFLLPLLMPFVIGMIIALVFRHIIDLIQKKTYVKRTFVSIFILILFYGLLALIISIIGLKVFTYVENLFYSLPTLYETTIEPAIRKIADNLILNFPGVQQYVEEFLNNISDSIFSYLKTISSTVVTKITGLAGQLPALLIKLIFTIVSSFFFTIDYYRISEFLMRQFRGERREMMLKLKDNGIGTLGKFIKAYSLIITITFLELSIGFWILGIPNPFLLGALVAIVDILPILGTGAILLPWSIISFVLGNLKIGIGMLLLYIVVTAVRQTIEPKIVGQQIGLHPIVTLLLMYVGAQLMGVLGLLILPIIATIIKTLNDEGTIHLIK